MVKVSCNQRSLRLVTGTSSDSEVPTQQISWKQWELAMRSFEESIMGAVPARLGLDGGEEVALRVGRLEEEVPACLGLDGGGGERASFGLNSAVATMCEDGTYESRLGAEEESGVAPVRLGLVGGERGLNSAVATMYEEGGTYESRVELS